MGDVDFSIDGFLDGRVQIAQPKRGYRAGTDPVLLAAACPAKAGDKVLDIGCGVGTAALCLHWRIAGLRLIGLEQDDAFLSFAQDNATRNHADFTVIRGDLFAPPATFKALQMDHIITNAPYFSSTQVCLPKDVSKAQAWAMIENPAQWIVNCLKRLRPKGTISIINRVENLPAVLSALDGQAGRIIVLPIAARMGKPANRVLIRATKGSRVPIHLLAPLYMHNGHIHKEDGDDFTPQARTVLRDGAALDLCI